MTEQNDKAPDVKPRHPDALFRIEWEVDGCSGSTIRPASEVESTMKALIDAGYSIVWTVQHT